MKTEIINDMLINKWMESMWPLVFFSNITYRA